MPPDQYDEFPQIRILRPYSITSLNQYAICMAYMKERHRTEKAGLTKTGVKKTLWLHEDEAESLRNRAFRDRRSEASIIREALRRFLGLED